MRRIVTLYLALVASLAAAAAEYRSMGPDIFDPQAAGEELVERAVSEAKRDDRKVLLLFGANWCPWCRRLHATLSNDAAVQKRLRERFVLVFIDANTRNDRKRNAALLEKYGNPTLQHGLPVFVVLASDGTQLATQETASLAADTDAEEGARVLAFLEKWTK